ncbi:UvrB/UvrC motif-containing protein [candidate division KSB1 bacterium]|nr:UvrB/UvrC motif-containing protein [candidate division KSB1 bacterium]
MLCEICRSNPATKKIHLIFKGQSKELAVCEECAEQQNLHNPFSGLSDSLGLLLFEFLAKSLAQHGDEADDGVRCENCGMSLGDFKQKGAFGCSDCYNSFRPVLIGMLRRIHGSSKHIGSRPQKLINATSAKNLQKLRQQLKQAIAEEKFEKAAELRDIIHDIENCM